MLSSEYVNMDLFPLSLSLSLGTNEHYASQLLRFSFLHLFLLLARRCGRDSMTWYRTNGLCKESESVIDKGGR